MEVLGAKKEKDGTILTPTKSFLLLGVLTSVPANFGENRSRNATVRVLTDGYTD